MAIQIWNTLDKEDYLEAFKAHPQIGASVEEGRSFKKWAFGQWEQSGMQVALEETIQALKVANAQYLDRFGYILIVCATGKSAEEMLAIIQARLLNAPEEELPFVAKEQEYITTSTGEINGNPITTHILIHTLENLRKMSWFSWEN